MLRLGRNLLVIKCITRDLGDFFQIILSVYNFFKINKTTLILVFADSLALHFPSILLTHLLAGVR
jgi:hypothetical protein